MEKAVARAKDSRESKQPNIQNSPHMWRLASRRLWIRIPSLPRQQWHDLWRLYNFAPFRRCDIATIFFFVLSIRFLLLLRLEIVALTLQLCQLSLARLYLYMLHENVTRAKQSSRVFTLVKLRWEEQELWILMWYKNQTQRVHTHLQSLECGEGWQREENCVRFRFVITMKTQDTTQREKEKTKLRIRLKMKRTQRALIAPRLVLGSSQNDDCERRW